MPQFVMDAPSARLTGNASAGAKCQPGRQTGKLDGHILDRGMLAMQLGAAATLG